MKERPKDKGAFNPLAMPFMNNSMPKLIAMDLLQFKSLALNFDATTAGRFIRSLLEKYPWAITAVKVQPDPGDMERMAKMVLRDAWICFLPEEPADWKGVKDSPEITFQTLFVGYVWAALTATNWQIFFDQIKGTKRFYNLPETCKMLGRSRPTVIKLIREGQIHAQKIGTEWAIPIEALEDYLDAAWHRPTPTPKPKKG
jgi:excisionase family DNA binding protein